MTSDGALLRVVHYLLCHRQYFAGFCPTSANEATLKGEARNEKGFGR